MSRTSRRSIASEVGRVIYLTLLYEQNKTNKTKTNKTKTNKTKTNKNKTRKYQKIIPLFPKTITNIIPKNTSIFLKKEIQNYFEEIQIKWTHCKRPIAGSYGDFVERSKGRFEIVPPLLLRKKIKKALMQSTLFCKERKRIRQQVGPGCREEWCILPVEPNTPDGAWHRDIFVTKLSKKCKKIFYMTQLLYLDDKADTEFCLGSENDPSNQPEKYEKRTIQAEPCSSIVFDGRMMHRGLKNDSDETRFAIYISYYAPWYQDKESIKKGVLHKDSLCFGKK